MQLRDYFRHFRNQSLSQADRSMLYDAILQKTQYKQSIWSQLSSFVSFTFSKRVAYVGLTALLVFVVYGAYMFDNSSFTFQGLRIRQGGVQASHVAQVMDFEGEFYVEQDGKKIQTSLLSVGDIVTLPANGRLVMYIDESTQAILAGPAQFTIQDSPGGHTLVVSYGKYVSIKSLTDTQLAISSSNKKASASFALSIQDIVVSQGEGHEELDFEVVETDSGHVVANKGSTLVIRAVTSESQEDDTDTKETLVASQQALAVADNDISLLIDPASISRALARSDVSQTFALDTGVLASSNDPSIDTNDTSTAVTLLTVVQDPLTNQKESLARTNNVVSSTVQDISGLDVDHKQVPSNQQYEQLRDSLQPSSLTLAIKDFYIAYVGGDQARASHIIHSVIQKLLSVYSSFDLEIPSDSYGVGLTPRLQYLSVLTSDLSAKIATSYYVPPTATSNLSVLSDWSNYLLDVEFGSSSPVTPTWNDLLQNLPSNLRFQ